MKNKIKILLIAVLILSIFVTGCLDGYTSYDIGDQAICTDVCNDLGLDYEASIVKTDNTLYCKCIKLVKI